MNTAQTQYQIVNRSAEDLVAKLGKRKPGKVTKEAVGIAVRYAIRADMHHEAAAWLSLAARLNITVKG